MRALDGYQQQLFRVRSSSRRRGCKQDKKGEVRIWGTALPHAKIRKAGVVKEQLLGDHEEPRLGTEREASTCTGRRYFRRTAIGMPMGSRT